MKTPYPGTGVTPRQVWFLTYRGYKRWDVEKWTRREASMAISEILDAERGAKYDNVAPPMCSGALLGPDDPFGTCPEICSQCKVE